MRFTAYNLTIESELALPELLPSLDNGLADVRVKIGPVASEGLSDGKQLGPFLWTAPATLWLHVPHIARFLVTGGKEIVIDPEPGIDEDSIRVFLLGSAIGALLFQRGLLILHGNAIRIGDRCMVCVGHSGIGKSTLAAGFMQRGYQILADDVVPVDHRCHAFPGFPRIKLWQDVADKLKIDTANLKRIRPGIEKFNYPLGGQFKNQSVPVRWVYILNEGHVESIQVELITGMDRFLPLRNNTYRLSYLHGLGLESEHLKLCGQLSGQIRLSRVTRPEQKFELDTLLDRLLADMAANP